MDGCLVLCSLLPVRGSLRNLMQGTRCHRSSLAKPAWPWRGFLRLQTPTWTEVDGGIDALQRPALKELLVRPVGGEQKHVTAQVVVEAPLQEPQVVVVTGEVAAVLVLDLQMRKEAGCGGGGESGDPDTVILTQAFVCRKHPSAKNMSYTPSSTPILQRATQHENLPSPTSHATKRRKTNTTISVFGSQGYSTLD